MCVMHIVCSREETCKAVVLINEVQANSCDEASRYAGRRGLLDMHCNTAEMASIDSQGSLVTMAHETTLLPQGVTCSAAAGFKEGALMGNSFRTALS